MVPGRQQDFVSRASRYLAILAKTKTFAMQNDGPIVSFTFDDIPDSALTNGAQVLEAHNARGTFYIAGGLCGAEHFGWTFAAAEDLSSLVDSGHEIGCHTFSHPDVQTLDRDSIIGELEDNRRFLEALDGRIRLENFAYPYGSVGIPQKKPLQDRFMSCRSVHPGINAGKIDLGLLRAVKLYDVAIDRKGIDNLLLETRRRKGWLIFYTHDVNAPPSNQGCSPELLDYAVRTARQAGCECLTVREALGRMGLR
jgi:peptidoglycan/xylan/chitin deacetylase (PgdA/CDA1 family)